MRLLRGLAVGVGLIASLAGASFAQTSCPTVANPACGATSPEARAALAALVAGPPDCAHSCERTHGADYLADFNVARACETPPVPPLALPPEYATAPVDQKIIMLINAERRPRNLTALNDAHDPAVPTRNDPVLGYVAENHSRLLAEIPKLMELTNPDGSPTAHNTAIDGSVVERITSIPGSSVFGSLVFSSESEIVASDDSPEGAVFAWMYGDAHANWGHRHAILDCNAQYAGAGFATRTSGFPLYTVDFIKSYNNAYKMMTLRPGTPKPSPQVLLGEVSANLLADGLNTMKISFTGKFYPVYGMANDIKWIYVWPRAVWGKPSGTIPALGVYPVGTGGVACVVHATHSATYTCKMTMPNSGEPIEIDAVDIFSNVVRIRSCPRQPQQDQTPCFQVSLPTPPEVYPRQ